MPKSASIYVLVPTYDRADVIRWTLPTWLRSRWVAKTIVVAEAGNEEILSKYEEELARLGKTFRDKVMYELRAGRSGSINARNRLLKLASEEGCDYAIMADDDYVLPNPEFPLRMARWFLANKDVGVVGGRVVTLSKRVVDPDFFLNTPIPMADPLTKVLGYVLLDIRNGPRYAEYSTPFYMLNGTLLENVKYDQLFATPTAFREESDVHEQIKRLGYKLLIDPGVYVYHLGIEYGGNRPGVPMNRRMYWKARNHLKFVLKWQRQPLRTWYIISATLLLTLYRPWHVYDILKGIRDGLRT